MRNEFKELVGFEGSIIELSNKLQALECEDICDFGNWSEILEDRNVVVAIDECGEKHIKLDFDVTITNGDDEIIEATNIKVTNVEEF